MFLSPLRCGVTLCLFEDLQDLKLRQRSLLISLLSPETSQVVMDSFWEVTFPVIVEQN